MRWSGLRSRPGQDAAAIDERNTAIEALRALPVETELSLLRLRALEAGITAEFNAGNFLCTLILTRQFVETVAHFVDTFSKVRKELR
jgi:hypothetical protein